MLSYYERELIRAPGRDDRLRCFRCNTALPGRLALRSEGLCTACAEGKTIHFVEASRVASRTGAALSAKSR
jgi:hypothetical protein